MFRSSRRKFLGSVAAGTGIAMAGCLGDDDEDQVTLQLPEGTLHYPIYEAAQDEGIFEAEGIDVEIEYPPFDTQLASVAAGEVDTTMVSVLPYIADFVRGEEFVTFGFHGTLQSVNSLYVLTESDFESVPDLEGERIGVWSFGSSTVQGFQAIIADQFGLDLQADFDSTTAAPPALLGLLQDGQIDGVINVSGLTITMESQPDTFRNLAYLNGLWLEETGHTLPLTSWWATEEWYDDNEETAAGLLRAARESANHWRDNTRDILEEWGEPGGVQGDAEIDVVVELADRGEVFAGDPGQDYVDATWQFLDLMADQGFLEDAPSQDAVLRNPL